MDPQMVENFLRGGAAGIWWVIYGLMCVGLARSSASCG
jgi:hypothetical protein